MAHEKLFHVGVKALIENSKKQVLLLHADVTTHRKNTTPYWDIPGGRIQEGHGVEETLQREIEEETGISAIGSASLMTAVVSNHKIPVSDTLTVGLLLVIYKVRITGTARIVLSPEHDGFEWLDKKEAAKRLAHKYPKQFTDLILSGA